MIRFQFLSTIYILCTLVKSEEIMCFSDKRFPRVYGSQSAEGDTYFASIAVDGQLFAIGGSSTDSALVEKTNYNIDEEIPIIIMYDNLLVIKWQKQYEIQDAQGTYLGGSIIDLAFSEEY